MSSTSMAKIMEGNFLNYGHLKNLLLCIDESDKANSFWTYMKSIYHK